MARFLNTVANNGGGTAVQIDRWNVHRLCAVVMSFSIISMIVFACLDDPDPDPDPDGGGGCHQNNHEAVQNAMAAAHKCHMRAATAH